MIGDGGSIWIAEAYAFGATAFDTAGALVAMDGGQATLRENFTDWVNLGYVPSDVSMTLEYANADFAISQFAAALGDTAKATLYGMRAQNWQNVFNAGSGLLEPKDATGAWVGGITTSTGNGYTEGTAGQYRWMVPFNLRGLFDKMGGNASAVQALDTFFTKLNDGINSPYCWMGNEPSLNTPFSYAFAGAPDKTQKVARDIETQAYLTTPGGIPGNDDGGATSSWYVLAAMGIYPEVPGVGGFVIGSPLFTGVTLHLAGGKTLQINAPAAADNAPYVQSLKLNGMDTTSLWLPWSTVAAGATLDFTLGTSPSTWGTGAADAPPSFTH
jgi:predicted alpha-1,2-mannosidase